MRKRTLLLLTMLTFMICFFIMLYSFFPIKYREQIVKYSKEYDIDPYLVISVINVESKFDKDAKSNKDARGLMQIREITGKWERSQNLSEELSEEDYYNPDHNIRIGCWYISVLKKTYGNNMNIIAAAYNAGMGNIDKWIEDGVDISSGNVPFEETKKYIKKINTNYKIYKLLYRFDKNLGEYDED